MNRFRDVSRVCASASVAVDDEPAAVALVERQDDGRFGDEACAGRGFAGGPPRAFDGCPRTRDMHADTECLNLLTRDGSEGCLQRGGVNRGIHSLYVAHAATRIGIGVCGNDCANGLLGWIADGDGGCCDAADAVARLVAVQMLWKWLLTAALSPGESRKTETGDDDRADNQERNRE